MTAVPHPGGRVGTIELLVVTARTMSWAPLLCCALGSLGITTVVWTRVHDTPSLIGATVAAAMAATGCATLGDPARLLLEPVRTSRLVRLSRRVVLAGFATTIALAVIALWARVNATTLGPSNLVVNGTIALFSTGVAVDALVEDRTDHAGEVAPLVAFGWFAAGTMIPDRFVPDVVTMAWLERPWAVTAAATVIIVVHHTERRWRPQ